MVIKSLELGQYTGLNIKVEALEIDRQIIINKMKAMMTEKASSIGIDSQMAESVIILDDDAAKSLQLDGVNNLHEFEMYIRRALFKDQLINNVMRQVLDNVIIEYDQSEIDQELDQMMTDIEEQATNEGFTLAFYCDYNNLKDETELRELCRAEICTSYLEIYTLEAIAKNEGITVNDTEYNLLENSFKTINESYSSIDHEALKRSLVIKSTVNWLVANNTLA